MNRLEKKCAIVSTGLHLSLLGLILIGPAFTSSTTPEVRMIDFMPDMVVAENVVGGGNPNARPPEAVVPPVTRPPQPVAQPPQPKAEPKTAPKPQPERTEPAKNEPPDPNDFTDSKKKKMPEIVTKAQTRRRPPTSTPEKAAAAEKEARKAADAQRALAREIAKAVNGIKEGVASATTIDEDFVGPGGGGPAYAGYASVVKYVYESAWVAPDDTVSDAAIAKVKVTIARDGSVVFSQIISRSGDSQMDDSVQRTLDRVRTVGVPFPEGMKERQRTYILRFDLKVKRGLA